MIIFGGEGQLGSDMTGIISSYKIISLGHKDVDITDFENVKKYYKQTQTKRSDKLRRLQ